MSEIVCAVSDVEVMSDRKTSKERGICKLNTSRIS